MGSINPKGKLTVPFTASVCLFSVFHVGAAATRLATRADTNINDCILNGNLVTVFNVSKEFQLIVFKRTRKWKGTEPSYIWLVIRHHIVPPCKQGRSSCLPRHPHSFKLCLVALSLAPIQPNLVFPGKLVTVLSELYAPDSPRAPHQFSVDTLSQ